MDATLIRSDPSTSASTTCWRDSVAAVMNFSGTETQPCCRIFFWEQSSYQNTTFLHHAQHMCLLWLKCPTKPNHELLLFNLCPIRGCKLTRRSGTSAPQKNTWYDSIFKIISSTCNHICRLSGDFQRTHHLEVAEQTFQEDTQANQKPEDTWKRHDWKRVSNNNNDDRQGSWVTSKYYTKVNKRLEEAIWHVSSSIQWETKCTFVRTHV